MFFSWKDWSLHRNARSPALFWPLPMSLRSFLLPLHYRLFTPTHTTSATMVAQRRWRWCICVDPHPNEKKIITPSERSRFAVWVLASVAAGRLSSPTSSARFCGMPFSSVVLFNMWFTAGAKMSLFCSCLCFSPRLPCRRPWIQRTPWSRWVQQRWVTKPGCVCLHLHLP